MPRVVRLLLLLTVALPYGGSGYCAPRTETASFGYEVIALYEEGRVPEARRALLVLARRNLDAGRLIKKNRPVDMQARLGIYHVAWLIPKCLRLEMMHAKKKFPPEIIAISEEVLCAMDAALAIGRKFPDPDGQMGGAIRSAEVAGERLVSDMARALKDTGQEALAREFAQRHAKFLDTTVDALLAQASAKPRPYGHQVLELYEKGELKEARRALVQFVRRSIEPGKRITGNSPRDMEGRLGVCMGASLIGRSLEFEAKAAGNGPIPTEVVAIANELTAAIDAALVYVAEQPEATERVKAVAGSARQSKLWLVMGLVRALLRTGDRESAEAVADQHAAFLTEMGKPAELLLKEATVADGESEPEPPWEHDSSTWAASAVLLAIAVLACVAAYVVRCRRMQDDG